MSASAGRATSADWCESSLGPCAEDGEWVSTAIKRALIFDRRLRDGL